MADRPQDAGAAWKNSGCYIRIEGENIRLKAELDSQTLRNEAQEKRINTLEQSMQSLLAEVASHRGAIQHGRTPTGAGSEYNDRQREFEQLQIGI
jgi:hypothetical protein